MITYLHRVRNEPSDPDKAIPKRNAPFEFVHADQTPAGGKAICDGIIAEHFTEEEKLHKTRKVLVNAWRPLKTIRRDPLAVLDWTSLDLESDLIPCPRINADSTWYVLLSLFPHSEHIHTRYVQQHILKTECGVYMPLCPFNLYSPY